METSNNSHQPEQNTGNSQNENIENTDLHLDKDVSGRDITDEGRDERRHHQPHGNRKYESYSNHSSADDQPQVDTGA